MKVVPENGLERELRANPGKLVLVCVHGRREAGSHTAHGLARAPGAGAAQHGPRRQARGGDRQGRGVGRAGGPATRDAQGLLCGMVRAVQGCRPGH
jgi:hypothetical protein